MDKYNLPTTSTTLRVLTAVVTATTTVLAATHPSTSGSSSSSFIINNNNGSIPLPKCVCDPLEKDGYHYVELYTNFRYKLTGMGPRVGSGLEPLLPPHTGEEVFSTTPSQVVISTNNTHQSPTLSGQTTLGNESGDDATAEKNNDEDERSNIATGGRRKKGGYGTLVNKAVVTAVGVLAIAASGFVGPVECVPTALDMSTGTIPPMSQEHGYELSSDMVVFLVNNGKIPLCDSRVPMTDIGYIVGSLAAWVSGALYFFSRIPQIISNHKNRSVEGLSLALFFFTLMGNGTYGLSVLLRVPAVDWTFARSELPYVVGSTGVLMFDIVILTQAYFYS
ncbi:hypothetical protein HDU76_000635 [Blyttiomyces sp. JEL0837]|nr:hypothetical protein HDU76_000635 [Blyttiomyces sp. JEL0837]